MNPELSIVLPAYREAVALNRLLPALASAAAELTPAFEIIVVDAQTPVDNTEAVCSQHNVGHLRRRDGSLYGDAVRTGLREAQGKYIILMDADGSHDPAYVRRLWEQRENHDLVIGSRYVDGGHTENPAILIFLSWVVNLVFRVVFRLRCRDVSNSFRLYRAEHIKSLHLRCRNFDIVEELLILLADKRIIEVPVTFERRKAGESKRNLVLFAISYLSTLSRLLWIEQTRGKQV
jgi:dolichol-phosphate mannosyltransferase